MSPDTSTNFDNRFLAIRQNDEKALKHLYQFNYPAVEKYVLDNSGTVEEAKDIFQEAFISFWRNIQLGRFEPQQETSLDAYLVRIAKNKWLDHLRAAKKFNTVPLAVDWEAAAPVNEPDDREQQEIKKVKEHFRRLGAVCRDLLQRFYFFRQSMRTIAEKLNWTEATAKNNKYRCLQQLRKMLNTKNADHG